MLELAVLGLLHDHDQHGYELKKQLTDLLGPWSSVSFGSLYPALRRLHKQALVEAVDPDDAPSAPMSGAFSGELALFRARKKSATTGRRRKVYAITAAGRERLHALLTEPPTPDGKTDDRRAFDLRVAFCRLLTADERVRLFEDRRAELARRLTAPAPVTAGDRLTDRYLRSLRDRDARTLTHDLEWLEGLIADEADELAEEARGA